MFGTLLFRLLCCVIVMGMVGPVPVAGQVGQNTNLWQWSTEASHHESIVQVELDGASGTGVIVRVDRDKPVSDGFQGWCLTAWHVISDDSESRRIRVRYRNGRSAKNCMVLATDEDNDVALLWVWVPASVAAVPLAESPAAPGEAIEIAGLGGGSGLECCLRHFHAKAAVTTNDNKIFADVALLPGDSGGPVFNDRAQLVGIVSGGWFWWDGGVVNGNGTEIRATWPARTSNLKSVKDLIGKARTPVIQVASK